jgi:hypothetical protein
MQGRVLMTDDIEMILINLIDKVTESDGWPLTDTEIAYKAFAKQALYQRLLEVIGKDLEPDIEKAAGIINGKRMYEPAYSLKATVINQRLATQRQALAELFGIKESES